MAKKLINYYRQSIKLANATAKRFKSEGVSILATSFYPTRLKSTVEFLTKNGVEVMIAGGGPGKSFVENAPQYSYLFDTTGMDETEENINLILKRIPVDKVPSKIGMILYNSATEGDKIWQKTMENLFPTTVICTNEQNLTSVFEEKTNLVDILKKAGLNEHIISSEIIKDDKTQVELAIMYKNLRDKNGRIVVQSCGPNVSEIGGGHSTIIANNFKEFLNACEDRRGYLKVATFVEGVNSNVSICAGNVLANPNGYGALKGELKPNESRYSGETIDNLIERAKKLGINESNIFSFVQPGTLKLVGDKVLTSCQTNGVGNQLNYPYSPELLEKIYNIGKNLGNFMAKCGKVGLFGIDLIITKDGNIYINEINDRQQGPTEDASINNEQNNLPGILRLGFLQNFANFNNKEVRDLMMDINNNSKDIYYESLGIKSPYYLKLAGERVAKPSKISLSSGIYSVEKIGDGSYRWNLHKNFEKENNEEIEESGVVDLSKLQNFFKITNVSLTEGENIEPDRQILRLNAMAGDCPFSIVEGASKLNEDFVPLISALKEEIYGKGYDCDEKITNKIEESEQEN